MSDLVAKLVVICGVFLGIAAPVFGACTDPEFVKALRTEYEFKQSDTLAKSVQNVACSRDQGGFAVGVDISIIDEITGSGNFGYNEVRDACNRNDQQFFQKYKKTIALRFLSANARDVLLACLGHPRTGSSSAFTISPRYRSCSEIAVNVTWRPREPGQPNNVTVSSIKTNGRFTCEGIKPGDVLGRDKTKAAYCKSTPGPVSRFWMDIETKELGKNGVVMRLNEEKWVELKGVNILERAGNNRYGHFRTNQYDECKSTCQNDPDCIAYKWRNTAQGANYPHECWLYGAPRSKIFRGAYSVIDSGWKDSRLICEK